MCMGGCICVGVCMCVCVCSLTNIQLRTHKTTIVHKQ